MATSSITKEFFVNDKDAFERLKKEIDKYSCKNIASVKTSSLEKGREKLSTFVFK